MYSILASLPFTRESSHIPCIDEITTNMLDSLNLSFSRIQRETPLYGSEISYLIDIPRIKGKFCPDKAKALGVPKGMLFKTLCMGGEVTVGDKVITSDMVMTPPTRGPCAFILSIHSELILTQSVQSRLFDTIVKETTLQLILHSSPFSLRSHPLYKQILSTLSSCQHYSLPDAELNRIQVHEASSFIHTHVSTLFPSLFPSLITHSDLSSISPILIIVSLSR